MPEERKINLNNASQEELTEIEGVGPYLASEIIKYRDEHGPFNDFDELHNVYNIQDTNIEKLKTKGVIE